RPGRRTESRSPSPARSSPQVRHRSATSGRSGPTATPGSGSPTHHGSNSGPTGDPHHVATLAERLAWTAAGTRQPETATPPSDPTPAARNRAPPCDHRKGSAGESTHSVITTIEDG